MHWGKKMHASAYAHELVNMTSCKFSHLLPPLQERGRNACSSFYLRCSRHHPCRAASGGFSTPPALSSSPPKTRSVWLSCGVEERGIVSPWPIRRWPGHWGTTPALERFRRWRENSPTGLMRRHWGAYGEILKVVQQGWHSVTKSYGCRNKLILSIYYTSIRNILNLGFFSYKMMYRRKGNLRCWN